MAFSAQPDHGQNDRKQRGFTSIARIPSKERTKFVPNPAAKPFVPSSNFDKLTRSNKTWSSANRRQNSLLKYDNNRNECNKATNSNTTTNHISSLHQNGSLSNGTVQLHPHSYDNSITTDSSLSTQSQPGKHIALHLLSKVLDDETIFNFTSIEESTTTPCSPSPASSPSIEFDGTAHSWPLSATDIHPHSAPTVSIPNYTTHVGSFSGPSIWSTDSCPATPPLSPDPSSCNEFSSNDMPSFPKPMRPNSLPDCDRFSPFINGFIDEQSPYPSPTGQSHSSSNASPLQTFLPIQEPYCNGKVQQSCESGYASNSTNNSYYGSSQMSPSTLQGFVHSSPDVHSFILPLSAPGSVYNSSPSLSPSSPPLGQMKLDRKHLHIESSDHINSKSRQSLFRDKGYQSPSYKEQNGYSYSSSPRTKSPFSSELHMRLDDCYEQLRCLERERKKAETEISHLWSSRKFSSPGNCVNFRLPPSPSRVDKMIIDQRREHAKVEALVSRIERIRHSPLHQSMSESVEQWQQSIKQLQTKRKEEMCSSNGIVGRGRLGSGITRFYDSSDILGLVSAVKDVYQQTRAMRTTVWCAVHLVTCETIPKVDVIQENDSTTLSKLNSEEGMDEVS